MPTSDTLPRWDLDAVFPGLDSRQLAVATEAVVAELGRLESLYDRHDVGEGPPEPTDAGRLAAFEEVVGATNALLEQVRPVMAYLNGHLATDAGDDRAAVLHSGVQAGLAPLQALTARFAAWVARFGADQLIAADPVAAEHAHALRQAEMSAGHLMDEGQERLYAELRLTGGAAWNKLHGDVTALLGAEVDGQWLPMTVVRGLATDPDQGRRERAYRAELAAWQSVEVPLAAALNAIKGEANTVNVRRGWEDALAPALHANSVERSALEAMQTAVVASFPHFRRFLLAKSRLLGHTGGLPWWELFAPVPGEREVTWAEAEAAVTRAFGSYSGPLAGLARRALSEHWVDAEPRAGKRGGAFCMGVRADESRVLLNFDGSVQSVQTLAHELGHAYHNTHLADRTPLQRRTPMALAETASIFCETIMVQSAIAGADEATRLSLLNVDLQGATQVVVDIHSRFLFEREVSLRRRRAVLPPAELCRLMAEAQDATYGEGLPRDGGHPWMWAVKPHYYSSAFYNWPYCFGLLFGIGLYARFCEEPDRFRARYDDALASTGQASAAELAARFGIDLGSEAFWTGSLDVVRARIDDFESLVGRRLALS